MKIKSIIVIVICLLLLSSFAGLAKACDCDPPCGTCETCQAGVCVEYGDCWGGCPTCKTCSGCWCVNKCHPYDCEACVDGSCESWCDPVCEECEYGYGECVCLIWVTDVNSDKDVACVGCEITFTATTGGDGPVSCIKWDAPGGEPNEGTGETFTTSWDCPTSENGSTVVTADTCRDGDDPSSWEKEVTIVAVYSLSPDVGTRFDDGDGDANTNSYAVWIATAGVVTVTADSYPGVLEENLPDGWDLTGGTVIDKLHTEVDRTKVGLTTITCTCNTSKKTTKIYVKKHGVCKPIPTLTRTGGCDCIDANCIGSITDTFSWSCVEDYGGCPWFTDCVQIGQEVCYTTRTANCIGKCEASGSGVWV